ncbi:MAG: hypothetical protein JWQ30_2439 [Sediminibacterium sp.]|nr:hypothetical protein [Sediminibacterium sp.]
MKKVIKEKSPFSDQIITLTISEELNKLDNKIVAAKKLAIANEILRKIPIEKIDKLRNSIDAEEKTSEPK